MADEEKPSSWLKRLAIAIAGSTGICFLFVLFWTKFFTLCFFYWRPDEYPRIAAFWVVLLPMFLASKHNRIILIVFAAFVYLAWPRGELFWLESGAGNDAKWQLGEFQLALDEYRRGHNTFPVALPNATVRPYARKYYDFEYSPQSDSSGRITAYVLRAFPKPKTRACHCTMSLLLTSDGQMHYTTKEHLASASDESFRFHYVP